MEAFVLAGRVSTTFLVPVPLIVPTHVMPVTAWALALSQQFPVQLLKSVSIQTTQRPAAAPTGEHFAEANAVPEAVMALLAATAPMEHPNVPRTNIAAMILFVAL